MKYAKVSLSILLAVLMGTSEFSFGQTDSSDGIQSQGDVVLERNPEIMRISVDILAKGKNMADALSKLKSQRASAEQQLATLGATKDSVKFGNIHQSKSDPRKQMQRMIQQRTAGKRGKKSKGAAEATPVDLSMKLTAEWPLGAADPAEFLTSVHKLQESIKSADLSGSKEADASSEEAAEAAEEQGAQFAFPGMAEETKPGEPVFLFVTKISPADRQKALTEAFAAAKTEATTLAKAAGLDLGPLRSLKSSAGPDSDEHDDNQQMQVYKMMMGGASNRPKAAGTDEAIGTTPGTLKYKVTVNATFAFK